MPASARPFSFVALGDTAYNGARDYPIYRALIETINGAKPAFTIHVGDIWGVGDCHDASIETVAQFFALYDQPVIYTPGDNEWTDCHHRAMGGYAPAERLQRLRDVFFDSDKSLGRKTLRLVRQSEVSPYSAFAENARWTYQDVLFFTANIAGSSNNFRPGSRDALDEAVHRNEANVAWIRDSFRIAREEDLAAVVMAYHAEMFESGRTPGADPNGPFSAIIDEIRIAAERFGKPVLLVHGDSHAFTVDRPLLESRGEAELPRYGNVTRLEVYGAPEIKAVEVTIDTDSRGVFGFRPLY